MSSEQVKVSTRDKILEAAIRLFAEKGFSGTTTREIAEKDPCFIRLLHFSALEGHELSDMFFDTYVQYQRMLLSDYIERRISEGAFKNVNPVLAARAFIGMVINYILVQEIFGEKKRRKIKREEVADTFVKIFLEGIKNN